MEVNVSYWFQFFVLILLAYIGFRVLNSLHFPASRIVGPIIVIALIQTTGFVFSVPTLVKIICSIIFGIYLGLRFDRDAIDTLKSVARPALLISILYIGITLVYGFLLSAMSSIDPVTAFFAVIPGGIAESSILAVSYGADLAQVSSFQLVRFLSIVAVVPLLAQWFFKPHAKEPTMHLEAATPVISPTKSPMVSHYWLFIIGALSSGLFYIVHFPAALLLGATFGVAAAQLISKTPFTRPPQSLYNYTQIIMGGIIGTSFTVSSLQAVGTLALPLLTLTFLTLSTSVILGYMFAKMFNWDFMTGFMAVLPGGLSTIIILADDYAADVIIISSMQTVRVITAVMIIPLIYQWIL